jgi:SAM-dependent methyltransferase
MIQNIYDHPEFFAAYKDLRDNDKGFNESVEAPAVQRLIKNVEGARVLDLGCGLGHHVGYFFERGAEKIDAVDVSKKMIDECAKRFQLPNVTFVCEAIENYNIGSNQYDIIVSSMALHYVNDLDRVFANVFQALKNEGQFVFSIEHPICTACQVGWLDAADTKYWLVKDYSKEGIRYQNWFVDDVQKYHRKLSTLVELLLKNQFFIMAIDEPQPSSDWLDKRPDLAQHFQRPPVLVIKACKQVD